MKDKIVKELIEKEKKRQNHNIELIASENIVSDDVLRTQGSILTNKYAEGYPGRRYYGGCEVIDEIEQLAIDRVKILFNCKYANVQPHSGSSANMAAYRAVLNKGDIVLSMALDQGGHLTHGSSFNFSGQDYQVHSYYVVKETQLIDYDALEEKIKELKPKLVIAGASSYARKIDFERIGKCAHANNALFMVDMAHIAGIVAAGLHQNPLDYADIVTSTTHKTLRGPRGGIILTNNEEIAIKVNKSVFPGLQGGPLMHVIAAKAVCFGEALLPSFKEYIKQVLLNTNTLAEKLKELGYFVITGGTDNHVFAINVKKSVGITGKDGEELLDKVGITCNKNTIPYDDEKTSIGSGLRLGAAAVTSRGFKEKEMVEVALLLDETLKCDRKVETLLAIRKKVKKLTSKFKAF